MGARVLPRITSVVAMINSIHRSFSRISGAGMPFLLPVALACIGPIRLQAQTPSGQQQPPTITHTEPHPMGPPVALSDLIREALEKNPDLIALRQQVDV